MRCGVKVVSVTKGQLYDLRKMDNLARLVAAETGKEIRVRVKDYAMKQYALRKTVLFSRDLGK